MWDVIKAKVKCKICGDIITSNNPKVWVECSCGSVKLLANGTTKIIKANKEDFIDLSLCDFIEQIPKNFRD